VFCLIVGKICSWLHKHIIEPIMERLGYTTVPPPFKVMGVTYDESKRDQLRGAEAVPAIDARKDATLKKND